MPGSLRAQSGNIFFALFGAVGLVGVLGAATMTIMKGPVAGMQKVTKYTVAENNMIAAGRLALVAAGQQANDGDCDGDGYIEPVEWSDTGSGTAPTGGGFLPGTIGAAKRDPWGGTFGYCAWDHGTEIDNAGCGGASQNRLAGTDSEEHVALVVISSGPDRIFQTTCADHDTYVTKDGDDILLQYTYAESKTLAGGLWNIKQDEPDVAEIAKNLEVKSTLGDVVFGVDSTTDPDKPAIKVDFISKLSAAATGVTFLSDVFVDGGSVGIGITTPLRKLDVAGDGTINGAIAAGVAPTGSPRMNMWMGSDSIARIWSGGAGQNVLMLNDTGNVGIGTDAPTAPLHVGVTTRDVAIFGKPYGAANETPGAEARIYLSNNGTPLRGAYLSGMNIGGVNHAHALVFGTNSSASAPVERMRITGTGSVGIGTTDPQYKLDVTGAIGASNGLYTYTTSTGASAVMIGYQDASNYARILSYGSSHASLPGRLLIQNVIGGASNGYIDIRPDVDSMLIVPPSGANGYMRLYSGGSESLRLQTNGDTRVFGRLGVGTIPSTTLPAKSIITANGIQAGTFLAAPAMSGSGQDVCWSATTGQLYRGLDCGDGSASAGDYIPITGGTATGALYSNNGTYGYLGLNGSNYLRFGAGTLYLRLGAAWHSYWNSTGYHPFATNTRDLGTTSNRWRDGYFARNVYVPGKVTADSIDMANTSGSKILYYGTAYGVGIESSTLTHWSAARHRWRIGGTSPSTGAQHMALTTGGLNITMDLSARGAAFSQNVLAAAYFHSSDRRLKENITPIDDPWALLDGVHGTHYRWKESGKDAYGVIAQDVETTMPEAVSADKKGMKSVEYDQLIAPLIEAVKHIKQIVDGLNGKITDILDSLAIVKEENLQQAADIAALKAENEALRTEIKNMKDEWAERQDR